MRGPLEQNRGQAMSELFALEQIDSHHRACGVDRVADPDRYARLSDRPDEVVQVRDQAGRLRNLALAHCGHPCSVPHGRPANISDLVAFGGDSGGHRVTQSCRVVRRLRGRLGGVGLERRGALGFGFGRWPVRELMRRGEIRWVDLEPIRGSEADKRRPAVVVSNDGANLTAQRLGRGVITVVPLTSNVQTVYPFQVFIPKAGSGLPQDSKAQAEQVRSVSVTRVGPLAGLVLPNLLRSVDDALRLQLAL